MFVSSCNAPPPLRDETKTAARETNIGAFKLPQGKCLGVQGWIPLLQQAILPQGIWHLHSPTPFAFIHVLDNLWGEIERSVHRLSTPSLFYPSLITVSPNSNDRAATRTSKKTIGLISKTTTLDVHHTFWYISLPFCTSTTWKYLISRLMENAVNKKRRNFLRFLNLDMFPWNSSSGGFVYIWQSKLDRNNRDKDWKNAYSLFKRSSR